MPALVAYLQARILHDNEPMRNRTIHAVAVLVLALLAGCQLLAPFAPGADGQPTSPGSIPPSSAQPSLAQTVMPLPSNALLSPTMEVPDNPN